MRLYLLALLTLSLHVIQPATAQSFVHPGLLHSQEDLDRMKKAVADKEEPIYSGYQAFIQNPASQHTYKMQGPMTMVGRNPTVGQATYDNDANAAHQNAIMWYITGEKKYAEKAIAILNAWSATLRSITGRDAVLMAGLGPFKMVLAAEILRYTNAGWQEADVKQTEKHFKEIIYPVLRDFAPFANGNWDAAAIKTVMSIGVFCNDRGIFERALRYYVNGHGNGRLTHYIINDDGQVQESGRDQGHTQLGIGMLAECSEIAWHQGLNLYSFANNRLLKGFEYVAKFNLGNEVPFAETLDRTGKYHHKTIARQDRGPLRAVYEQVYYHYVNRMGLPAPFTTQAAEKIRPEGPGKPGADHPGYGTLFYTKPIQKTNTLTPTAPFPPAAVIATGSSSGNTLKWVEPIAANRYTVKRATKTGGPFVIIAKNITEAAYTDKQVKAGTTYYYTVSASNAKGESGNAYKTVVAAGLPSPWKQQDVGEISMKGSTSFDGSVFRMEGGGMGIDSTQDAFHFAYMPLNGDGEITARFVPQPGSQFSKMGLMMREGLSANAAHASLLIYPGKTGQVEAPDWHIRLLSRTTAAQNTTVNNIGASLSEPALTFEPSATQTPNPELQTPHRLSQPAVTWGRLTGHCWLRLLRKGESIIGYMSLDGNVWKAIGTIFVPLKKDLLVGLPVSSGIKTVSTIVLFDRVNVSISPK